MNRLESKLEKIGRDVKVTAKAVGLRYAANSAKGYFRRGTAGAFTIVDENNKTLRDKAVLERIQKLVLPPAWTHVWISPFDNGHLQATGIDAKGRKQYRYHSQWNKIRNQSKFYRLRSFADALPAIREQVDKDLARSGMPYEKVVALVVKLIEMTNIRIGNDAYKKLYGSFGLTTLQDKHIRFERKKIWFEFVGKKGIPHKISLQSRRLARLVRQCRDIPGQDLFQYYDDAGQRHLIGSADINNYLKQISDWDFTAKDFRVWAGSVNALCAFQASELPANQTVSKQKVVEVLDGVAASLGNTRAVCRKYYVHPNVIAAYEKGTIWKYRPNSDNPKLSADEAALLALLQNETIAEASA